MRRALALLLALLAIPVAGQVYRSVNPDGSVEYSDQPAPGARPVELPPLPTVSPAQLPTPRSVARPAEEGAAYRRLAVTSPVADEGVRANDGNVVVSLALDPPLGSGHGIVLMLDGQQVGDPVTSLSLGLPNLDRGTHQVAAAVVDASGKRLITSAPVTFHVLRVHVGGRNPAPPPGSR